MLLTSPASPTPPTPALAARDHAPGRLVAPVCVGGWPPPPPRRQVSIVVEQLLRMMHACGMPAADVDLLHGPGATMGEVLRAAEPRSTLFTGSQKVAERLAVELRGKVGGGGVVGGWEAGGAMRMSGHSSQPAL